MTKLIDGKTIAARLTTEIAAEVEKLNKEQGCQPGLAVILVGEDPASQIYVRNKARQTEEVGMRSFEHRLSHRVSQQEVLDLISGLNDDDGVDGILVQLPLPDQISEHRVINAINPAKDVDGFHVVNRGHLATGMKGLVPCTPLGCLYLLKETLGDLNGKRALVLGRSNIVGRPMAELLLRENCTVTIAHSRTAELEAECRRAEILVVAVGRPQMVKREWVGEGAAVIDVGINRIEDDEGRQKLVGDVDFDGVSQVAGYITPVPGGVGPMTIALLLQNTLQAAIERRGLSRR
ncbi:MAG: bifunctional methylenetetrahydrofolate dehydrogenase/methenyltetrahydrofolate cyclohydrolase FolD [Acidiferrobacteraceae bacterium]|jgi:methylenetetrahydrofolate dehydrogenase (NADP+)/methenyltetrahydrofolate cyclohydrolase|nr:bifunctional methylenetetrahydrofolate dehydrogenase/methenyltetrahydrofolate cyclohydrolase FolD [Acidiferrobacteraceae bacterium]MDP6434679.1 bifunctional methylenetetrahydrofolate dehydrogenase/methenyltetrahydrofolate cyclohydrolase FolD [Arenicellales bacterium]MDP6671401.1 bifunctional methylenetetrahydrofolate dehydrogenase/methenyltetrahydrofolate cyclohydrolase FolD [Arenicellales bacterium]MDP6724311.1 bifunctional methylenetetrahydrofolate dehydrogenase/methenyltetrahydrofolate cyc|tara:strand:- start:3711 stop:4586 length:876 start_codon:yes stop_codon:yes gene_type:complete